VIAVEINLHFDVQSRDYNSIAISFLEEQGHRLDEHKDRGVLPEWVFAGLLRHLPFGDHSVTWITYHGDRDVGFLLRLLQAGGRGELPPDRVTFLHQVREKFPAFYDVRVLGQVLTEGFAGKLTKLAEDLGIERIGDSHFAGSDALLTLSCYSEIAQRSQSKLAARLSLLSGAEEWDMGIKCGRSVGDDSIITVDVREHNFEEEKRRIGELITSNFKIIGLQVLLPKLTAPLCETPHPQQEYDLMKSRFNGINKFQIIIGFMNADGIVAYGRLWKFHFSLNRERMDGNVHPLQFAELIASSGASHNTEVSWVTFDGSHGVGCLIKSFMMPKDLPPDLPPYLFHLRACFPVIYDMRFLSPRCPDIARLLTGCNGEPGVVLLLRCYKRISEHADSTTISSDAQRKLMVG
jgi:hypothetical protein